MLFITHLKWFAIEQNFRFNVVNYRSINSKTENQSPIKSSVYLRKISFQDFYLKYLKNTAYKKEEFKSLLRMDLQMIPEETFAFCWGDSKLGQNNDFAIRFLVDSLSLYGFSHIEVGMGFLFSTESNDTYDRGDSMYSTGGDSFYTIKEKMHTNDIYILKRDNRDHFGKFLKLFSENWKGILNQSHIKIAFRHFNSSLSRIDEVEQVLHIIIGLEAILSPKSKSELSYRVSQYASLLIGKNREEREKIYYLVREGYNIRSLLAHGEFKSFNKKSHFRKLDESPIQCIEYLRNILRDVLTRSLILNLGREEFRQRLQEDAIGMHNSLHKLSFFRGGYGHEWAMNE